MNFDTVYSPDDGGHYAEIWHDGGKTLHTTCIYPTASEATRAARYWIVTQQEYQL